MEGKHSIDTGLLAMPVLIEMMHVNIGDKNGVEYDSGGNGKKQDMANSDSVKENALARVC